MSCGAAADTVSTRVMINAGASATVVIVATATSTCGPYTNTASGTFGAGQTISGSPATGTGNVTGKVTVAVNLLGAPLEIALSGTGVTPSTHSVTLTWNASTSSVAGYKAYRATTAGGPYASLNSTANPQLRWTDSTVQSGTTYYYVVTSVAADTVESTYSNQATAAIPKP